MKYLLNVTLTFCAVYEVDSDKYQCAGELTFSEIVDREIVLIEEQPINYLSQQDYNASFDFDIQQGGTLW